VVNGSDLRIYYHGKLLAKFEILNFDSNSYINSRRAKNIRENLKNVKYKGLICSFFNATSRAKEILKNIPICTIGFQLLPSKFHKYYARLNKVHHRRIANNRSLKQIKNRIKSFFHRIGLDLLMYVEGISKISRISGARIVSLNNSSKSGETKNNEARTEEKTKSPTLNDYTVPPSGEVTEKCSSFDSTSAVSTETVSTEKLKHSVVSSEDTTVNGNELKYVYENTINSKNICENNSSKNRETGNRRAITEEKTDILNLLWHDKCGSVTLAHWIPMKMKIKQKTKNKRKLFSCPFRIVLVCPHYGQFYSCLIQIVDDYATKLEKYGYSEEYIDKLIDMALLRHIWKYKDQILGRCKCKPISIIDDEITSRKSLNGIAVTEPCKKTRCSQLIKDGKCEWMELLSEHKVKPRQLKLVGFMNGDDQHGQT
jgi:hypothetical protein